MRVEMGQYDDLIEWGSRPILVNTQPKMTICGPAPGRKWDGVPDEVANA